MWSPGTRWHASWKPPGRSHKAGCLISTTRAGRFGNQPARWIFELASERTDLDFEIVDLRDYPLPLLGETDSLETAERWSQKMNELDGYSRRSGHPLSYVRTALRPRQCKAPRPGGPRDHGSLSPVHFDFRRSVARADRRGILGVGTGFAFIQSPATNAAANSLPEEEVGGGMGIFAGSSSSAVGRDRRSSGRSWRHEKRPAQPR